MTWKKERAETKEATTPVFSVSFLPCSVVQSDLDLVGFKALGSRPLILSERLLVQVRVSCIYTLPLYNNLEKSKLYFCDRHTLLMSWWQSYRFVTRREREKKKKLERFLKAGTATVGPLHVSEWKEAFLTPLGLKYFPMQEWHLLLKDCLSR